MLKRLFMLSAMTAALAAPVSAQVIGGNGAPVANGATAAPDARPPGSTVTPPPGVTDPTTTNSTTGTVDQEDHCQPPGTQSNSNPSAEVPALPRTEAACN